MHYLMLITMEESEASDRLEAAVADAQVRWTRSLIDRGTFVMADRLRPTTTARSGRRKGGRPVFTDGPFVETKEHLGGYYLVDVPDLDAAVELAGTMPVSARFPVFVMPAEGIATWARVGEKPAQQTMVMYYGAAPAPPKHPALRAWARPVADAPVPMPLADGRVGVGPAVPAAVALIDGPPTVAEAVVGASLPEAGGVELRPVVMFG